jgi:hypothetical protein
VDNAAEMVEQLFFLVVDHRHQLVMIRLTPASAARRQWCEGPLIAIAELPAQPLHAADTGGLATEVPDRIVEPMATPTTDLIAQENVPTSLRTNGTLKPRALVAERLVPGQPDEHSVDRDAGPFPAKVDRADGARATHGSDFKLGGGPRNEATAPRERPNIDAHVRLNETDLRHAGVVMVLEDPESAHQCENNAPTLPVKSCSPSPSTSTTPATVMTASTANSTL